MKSLRLSNEEAAATGWTHKWIIDYADLVAAGATTALTQTLKDAIPARSKIDNVTYNLVTPFDGGATSELTMKLGFDLASGTDDDDAFLVATSIHADATYIIAGGARYTALATDTVNETYTTEESTVIASLRTTLNQILARSERLFLVAWDLEAVFTATGANLSALTTGEVHIMARLVQFGSSAY